LCEASMRMSFKRIESGYCANNVNGEKMAMKKILFTNLQ
jgi:hypothetical protein